jgi:hypothetical protein
METDDDSSVYQQFRWRLNALFESVCADRESVGDTQTMHAIYFVNLRLA